jgi:hypothetical protein
MSPGAGCLVTLTLALAACAGKTDRDPVPGVLGAAGASCPMHGEATPGPADNHCLLPDGGSFFQFTQDLSCHSDASPGDDGGATCSYGPTAYGQESDDDGCKYHVKWTSTPICAGADGVNFDLYVTSKETGWPQQGAGAIAETFMTSPTDSGCEMDSAHRGPNTGVRLTELGPGGYSGRIVFDVPGQWIVRFHFFEDCDSLLPASPHGHAAYHVTVP